MIEELSIYLQKKIKNGLHDKFDLLTKKMMGWLKEKKDEIQAIGSLVAIAVAAASIVISLISLRPVQNSRGSSVVPLKLFRF